MNQTDGWRLALELKDLLKGSCSRIEVAGGLRRGKEECHDIELVCKPTPKEIFGYVNCLDERLWELLMDDKIKSGTKSKDGKQSPMGPRYYRIKYKGEKVDIFSVIRPAQWGVIFLIRTGSAEYSHWFVSQGLNKLPRIAVVDGHIEQGSDNQVTETSEEEDAFRAMGVEFRKPEFRMIDEKTHLPIEVPVR